jgi:hypothetical protein
MGMRFYDYSLYQCHFNPVELLWSQAKRYYSSNIGQNGFGTEAVKMMWEESLEQACYFCSVTSKQRIALSHEIPSITNFV